MSDIEKTTENPKSGFIVHDASSNDVNDLQAASEAVLATRWKRLTAAIIDVIASIPIILLIFKFVYIPTSHRGISLEWCAVTMAVKTIFFACNYKLLLKGQTIGKSLMKIRIVTLRNEVPSLFKIVVIRDLIFLTFLYIIGYLNLNFIHIKILDSIAPIDYLFIFGRSRRCLHDYAAGTKVINVK